jgi:hypothetical protein
MAQTFYPITPVDVTPGTTGSYQDVDCSSYIPEGATGAILHIDNSQNNNLCSFYVRKNGSTNDQYDDTDLASHSWDAIGVDGNRIFEAKVEDAYIKIYLVGYTKSGVTFFTNYITKTPGTIGSWQDIDCSSDAPNAVGLIFQLRAYILIKESGLRKNGSTDNRHPDNSKNCMPCAVIGCDESQVCECYIESTYTYVHLIGYITDGVTFNTNATDMSLESTGSWLDLSALPSDNEMGIIEIIANATDLDYGLRKNGSSETIYGYVGWMHTWGIVECDTSQIIEGKIETTGVDFFLVGYAEAAEGEEYSESATVLIGVKPIASRAISLIRSASVLIGVKPIANRAISLTRTALVYVGIKPLATRALSYINSASVLVGIKPIASRLISLTRSATVQIGVKPIASRLFSIARTASVLVGIKPIASRIISLIRSASVQVGIKATGIRSWIGEWTETALVYIGVKPIASRAFSLNRTATVLVGIKPVASRIVSLSRTASVIVGIKPMASRSISLVRSASVLVGVKAIASASWLKEWVETALVKVGVKATASATWTLVKVIEAIVYFHKRAFDVIFHNRAVNVFFHKRNADVRFKGK